MSVRIINDFTLEVDLPGCCSRTRKAVAEMRQGAGYVSITLPAGPYTDRTVTVEINPARLIEILADLRERAK